MTHASETKTAVFEFPCSLAQQRFWVLDQLTPGEACYNIAVRWQLLGKLDPVIAERAFNAMVQRHEVLRTTFRSNDGEPLQVVHPEVWVPVPVCDVRSLPDGEREKEAERITLDVARKQFDLTEPPLVRATLLRLRDEEHVILVTVHHIVADGWSIGIMAKEFGDCYQALAERRPLDLPELPIQYADFAIWQKDWMESEALSSQVAYWKQKLGGLKQLEVKSDFPRPAVQTSNGNIVSVLLPRQLTNAAKEFSNRKGATLYTTALATFKTMLWQVTGQSDVGIGTQVVGRNQVELEQLVGAFINTLLLRTQVSGEITFDQLLDRVQETVTEALANQETPFERLVEILRPKRDLSRNPLFSVNFIYQRAFIENREFAGISLVDIPSRSPGAMYDLNFFMVERVDGWRWSCEYNTDLYSIDTVKGMLARFQSLLETLVENPGLCLADLGAKPSRPVAQPVPVAKTNQGRPQMEAELTKLWEELLTVSPIHKRDDFFEIGGHSLLALRFLARIEKQYGKKISLATLFQSPTIEKFTGILLGETTSAVETPGIGKLQPLGVKPAFFWVNGWPTIRNLALEIGTDQPFYTVNLPDDHDLTPPYNVAEIAARYIRIIQEAQPHGPYMLGGWCRAGLIAYEIAQQLQKQGEEIALVGLFDTWSPTYLTRYSDSEARRARMQLRWERFRFHGKNVLTKGFREAIAYTIYHLRNIQDRFKVSSLRRSYRLKNMLGLSIAKQSYTETEMIFLATNDYRPKAFSGRTILFRFDEYKDWKYWDPNLGWGEYLAGDLEVHEVPGRHNSEYFFTGPHLAAVARAMANAVNGGPIPSSASRPKLQQIEPSATATLSRS